MRFCVAVSGDDVQILSGAKKSDVSSPKMEASFCEFSRLLVAIETSDVRDGDCETDGEAKGCMPYRRLGMLTRCA